jgi:hypothetical protein
VSSDLFYDEIRLINFSFSHPESEFVWEVTLRTRLEVLFKKFHPKINLTTLF